MASGHGIRLAWALVVLVAAPACAWGWVWLGHGVPEATGSALVMTLLLTALLEELVFRGALQPWLAAQAGLADRRWLGITAANGLTSLLFAAAHLFNQPALQAAAVLPVSLLLGKALEQSGRLAAPMALHLYFNGLLWLASALAAWH